MTEELPSYPHEHPEFWDLWRAAIRERVPEIDVLFTSEEYGDRLAEVLGCRHLCVDLSRTSVPVSATQVRANPLALWDYLPEAVRPYFVKRVLIYGPESTGKSTLARQLAEHYHTAYVPEFARDYLAAKGDLDGLTYSDIAQIAAGQLESEEEAARRANRLLFCDTDLVTTTIYAHHYFGKCPGFVERLADERRYDLYLLTDIDFPHEADAQRDLPHRREEFAARFRTELDSRRVEYAIIRGSGPARLRSATAAVDHFLKSCS